MVGLETIFKPVGVADHNSQLRCRMLYMCLIGQQQYILQYIYASALTLAQSSTHAALTIVPKDRTDCITGVLMALSGGHHRVTNASTSVVLSTCYTELQDC